MVDEQHIRAAYEAIAAVAPPPERVRARIAAQARVHRQRRALLVGAGALGTAAAATAVGVPLLSRARPEPAAPPLVAAPGASAGGSGAMPAVPIRYAPGWLPDRLGEQYREVKATVPGAAAGSTRSWMPVGERYPQDHTGPAGVTLTVDERIDDDSGQPVMIGSVQGRLRVTDSAFVEWQPPGGPSMIVTVFKLPDQVEVALRVARSVAATDATMQVTMRSPWVPARYSGFMMASVHPTATGWRQWLSYCSADYRESFTIFAQTGPAPASVAYRADRPGGVTLWVPSNRAGGGATLTPEEAERMLRELVVTAPDLAWVGRR
jgi:hypothetical protein